MEPQLTIEAAQAKVTVETCPHRRACHDGGFCCELLHQITGAESQLCGVPAATCRVCVNTTNETGVSPTAEQPNHVVASMAIGIGHQLGGESGAAILAKMRPFIPRQRLRRRVEHHEPNATFTDSLVATVRKSRRFAVKAREVPFRWSVGITTAPRKSPTLERTLRSLHTAGWSDVTIFAEPGTHGRFLSREINVAFVQRPETLNAWRNWLQSLRDLVEQSPDADAYFVVQDDVAFSRGAREFLEATLWPGGDVDSSASKIGLVSIYCPTSYAGEIGYNRITRGGSLIGALAWIFPPDAARAILADPVINAYRGIHSIDGTIGEWAQRVGREVYYLSPSLAQHTGDTSTVWGPAGKNTGHRRSANFVGEGFDARRLVVRDGEDAEEVESTHPEQTIGGAITSAAGAAVDVMKRGMVNAATRAARRELCNACDHRTQKLGIDICDLCWCSISAKTAVPGQSCPMEPPRWGTVPAKSGAKSGCCGGK